MYRSVELWGRLIRGCLQALIACQIRRIKALDIFPKRSMLKSIPLEFSHPVNFQHNLNLPELAVKQRRSKVLKVKPLRDFHSLLEAFSFGG